MKRDFYRCNQISSLLIFGRRETKSEPEINATGSGKGYRVDTRKRYRGKYPKTFLETDYSPILSESDSEREENHPNNP